MNEKTSKWLDEHKDELISTLQEAIKINSVRDDSTAGEGAPFGIGPAKCLEYVLGEAEKLGFDVKNYDGYVGAIDCGQGEEQLGILAHLDVVPEGNGWKYPPYGGEIHDGYLWGRGTLDDKGPGIAAIFALAAVKNCGFEFSRRVRIILGCDEECGMGCLNHYCQVEKAPALAFSPDAEYPLINSEKLIYNAVYQKKFASSVQVYGGTVSNAVTGECDVYIQLGSGDVADVLEKMDAIEGITYQVEPAEGGCHVHITGIAAHASTPHLGKNAFYAALDLLRRLPIAEEDRKTAEHLFSILGFNLHGEGFGIDSTDASGRLTMNCGVIHWDDSGIDRLTVDIRAPISADAEFITKQLQAGFAKAGCSEIRHGYSDGYYIPPESEIVSKLIKVYNDNFHTDAKPMAIGGGTYARHLKNAVAFGPERPGELACIHMANECVSLDHLLEDAKIYAEAIIALACK